MTVSFVEYSETALLEGHNHSKGARVCSRHLFSTPLIESGVVWNRLIRTLHPRACRSFLFFVCADLA
jgi:hypothetical protein